MKEAFFTRSTMTENEILSKMAEEMLQVVLQQAKPAIHQILVTANANGFPVEFLQYVFWLLVENQRDWPPSLKPPQKKALMLLREILLRSGEMPPYRSGLEVPPGDTEPSLDATFEALSLWAQKLAIPITKAYMKLLKKYAKAIRKANPDIPKRREMVYLKAAFEQALRYQPQTFPGGQLLYRTFNTLFR
jgi:hypothetical protein